MLFYVRCPSCGRILSYDLDKYHDDVQTILDDPNKTKIQKEKDNAALLDKYGYKQICCRMRILGLIPYHKIVQT